MESRQLVAHVFRDSCPADRRRHRISGTDSSGLTEGTREIPTSRIAKILCGADFDRDEWTGLESADMLQINRTDRIQPMLTEDDDWSQRIDYFPTYCNLSSQIDHQIRKRVGIDTL